MNNKSHMPKPTESMEMPGFKLPELRACTTRPEPSSDGFYLQAATLTVEETKLSKHKK
jgi:hypothetical protein